MLRGDSLASLNYQYQYGHNERYLNERGQQGEGHATIACPLYF